MSTAEKVMASFVKLPLKSRLSLVKKMIVNLEQEDIREAWITEAERRIDAALRGDRELLSGQGVLEEIRRKCEP